VSQPQITGSQSGEIRELPPPPAERTKAHKWLTEKCQADFHKRAKMGYELYISKVAEEKIRNHALLHVPQRKEVMGLLLGGIYSHEGMVYSLVRDVVTTDLDATDVSVRFDREGFEKLFASLEEVGFRYVIVGWYHSHPSYHCFMSGTDVATQRNMFGQRAHSAIVIDPVNREIDAFYLDNGKIHSRPFSVFWDEFQNPYYGTTVRMRQVADK
jgi:proteasome lid subunit RPN8/RPN11